MMDAQKFLAEFGHVANAPGGVARLRELVRHLAIQGKLIAQNPNDKSASDLLREIRVAKKRLISHGQLRRETSWPQVSEEERGFQVPRGWIWARFGEVTINRDGERVPVSSVERAALEKIYDYYGASGVIDKIDRFIFDKTLLLVGEDGANLINRSTPIAFLAHGKYWVNNHAHVIDATHSVLLNYLALFLNSISLELYVTGTAQPKLNQAKLNNIAVPMPPLEEQARIVAKVDELMVLCDRLEAQQQERRKLQNALRQSTLQALASAQSPLELQAGWERLQNNFGQLFSEPEDVKELRSLCVELAIRGALSPADTPNDSSNASELLEKLTKLKTGKRSVKSPRVDPPFELPAQWQWVFLDDLLQGAESGWSPKCDAEPRHSGEWGVLKVSAVTWGNFRPNENKRLPPSFDPRPEYEVKPGDFLISRANTAELVARSVIVENNAPDRLLMSDKIVRLIFIDPSVKDWVNLVNNSQFAREYYRANATGTSDSMRNVSRQVIHELPIPLPPKSIQAAVIKKLAQLDGFCNSLAMQFEERSLTMKRFSSIAIEKIAGILPKQENAAELTT
jgi:type I restriction enzyme S subunit